MQPKRQHYKPADQRNHQSSNGFLVEKRSFLNQNQMEENEIVDWNQCLLELKDVSQKELKKFENSNSVSTLAKFKPSNTADITMVFGCFIPFKKNSLL